MTVQKKGRTLLVNFIAIICTRLAFPNTSCTAVLADVLVTVVHDSLSTWKANCSIVSPEMSCWVARGSFEIMSEIAFCGGREWECVCVCV